MCMLIEINTGVTNQMYPELCHTFWSGGHGLVSSCCLLVNKSTKYKWLTACFLDVLILLDSLSLGKGVLGGGLCERGHPVQGDAWMWLTVILQTDWSNAPKCSSEAAKSKQ